MSKERSAPIDYRKKMIIAESLFNFAYKVKSYQLRKKFPTESDEKIHERTIELIDKGCR